MVERLPGKREQFLTAAYRPVAKDAGKTSALSPAFSPWPPLAAVGTSEECAATSVTRGGAVAFLIMRALERATDGSTVRKAVSARDVRI